MSEPFTHQPFTHQPFTRQRGELMPAVRGLANGTVMGSRGAAPEDR